MKTLVTLKGSHGKPRVRVLVCVCVRVRVRVRVCGRVMDTSDREGLISGRLIC